MSRGDAEESGDGDRADAERGEPDAVEGGAVDSRGSDDAARPCPACGAEMFRRHCKYVCPRHGVVYDCSDPFYG